MTMPKVPAELIDAINQLDEIRRITSPLKKRDGTLAPLIRTQLGPGTFDGPNCIVIVRRTTGNLDTQAIVRDMSEDWVARYRKEPGLSVTLRPKGVSSELYYGSIGIFSRLWAWFLVRGRLGRWAR
jgi:hypothetical protein